MHPSRVKQNHSNYSQKSTKSLSAFDIGCLLILIGATFYLAHRDPLLFGVLGCMTVLLLGLWHISQAIPVVEKALHTHIHFWHVATAIITTSLLSSVLVAPAHALFLSGLEAFFVELANSSAVGGAAENLSEDVIALVFNLIRGVFLLLVAAAALFAYNQAQQGNDWRPIVTQVGLAFAIVIAIDVVTYIFIGDGTTASTGITPIATIVSSWPG